MSTLMKVMTKVKRTPLLSKSASLLIDLMGKSDYSLQDITHIVECDAILTVKVLEIVNSAAFSPRQPVTSPAKAVSLMGDKMVVGVAIATCAGTVYTEKMGGYESEEGELWKHSLMTAMASREVAKFSREKISPEIAYTGGILHDIGKSIISEFLDNSTQSIVEKIDSKETKDYLCAEREMLSTEHCVIGGKLAKHWNLPEPLQVIIFNHHTPSLTKPEEYIPLVYTVHLGDMIAMMGGAGTGADSMMYQIDTKYEEYIDISEEVLSNIFMKVTGEFKKTEASLFGNKKD